LRIFSGFRDAFKIPDLRKKILFTFMILAVYRVGCFIPSPGVNVKAVGQAATGPLLSFLNMFTGGGLSRLAIFGLGIMPYITASIIMELLSAVIPKIKEWHEEGEVGRRKITQITRYMTLVLALMESVGLIISIKNTPIKGTEQPLANLTLAKGALIVLTLVAGMALLMWLGELITERGVGNGMSILIFAGIISVMPTEGRNMVKAAYNQSPVWVVIIAIAALAIVVGVVYMEKGERRIPVQYAKQVRGRRMYSGASTYIPVKVNTAGVIPIIFAASVLHFPLIIASFFPSLKGFANAFSTGTAIYFITYTGLIIFFAYFYTAIIFDPFELADNLKKYGGFIPGIRPGMPTTNYVSKVVNRINLPGSIYIAIIALIPAIFFVQFGTQQVPIGGAAVIIIVGVALETMTQIEAQMQMRHYEGFLSR
jgi:preprotein translocase subunit SecY